MPSKKVLIPDLKQRAEVFVNILQYIWAYATEFEELRIVLLKVIYNFLIEGSKVEIALIQNMTLTPRWFDEIDDELCEENMKYQYTSDSLIDDSLETEIESS